MQLRPQRIMKKTAKPAAKKAPKKPAEPKPMIIGGSTEPLFGWAFLNTLLAARPTNLLKEDLRARGIGIPKTKDAMVYRLSEWAKRDGATFILQLR